MKHLFTLIFLSFFVVGAYAQVGIGTPTPDSSAQLEVHATDKGFLMPRVSLTSSTDITTVPNPAQSLLVYNTSTIADVIPGYYYWDSLNGKWQALASSENMVALGEDVTSTDGSILGVQADAALVTMDLEVNVDDTTLEVDATNGVQVKDAGITVTKIGADLADANKVLGTDATGLPQWQDASTVATSLGEDVTSTDGSILGVQGDAALVAMDLEVNVDDTTLEVDATNGVQVKDAGITVTKIGAELADANKVLGTDATGLPQWQDASTVATSLGEDVTSTDGSILGVQGDAALVAMDLEVNVDDTTLEVDATNGVQVKDAGITVTKIGAELADANKVLGTDATGLPQWQDASTVATSLGEDVTSTDGSILGVQADAALVAMDLEVNVDDTTLEVDATNGVQVKDAGITVTKIGALLADANKVLGTDATGLPQWQDASTMAANLGEDVYSTDGSITGVMNDATLIPMDLEVNVDDTTLEVDATNGVQVKDGGVTGAKLNANSARNGLTYGDGGVLGTNSIELGGALSFPTTITTDATNTLAIVGLEPGDDTDNLVVADATSGELKALPVSSVVKAYSTSETITGKKWTNGADVYEIVVNVSLASDSTQLPIGDLSATKIINLRVIDANGGVFHSAAYDGSNFVTVGSGGISTTMPAGNYDVIAEYLK